MSRSITDISRGDKVFLLSVSCETCRFWIRDCTPCSQWCQVIGDVRDWV